MARYKKPEEVPFDLPVPTDVVPFALALRQRKEMRQARSPFLTLPSNAPLAPLGSQWEVELAENGFIPYGDWTAPIQDYTGERWYCMVGLWKADDNIERMQQLLIHCHEDWTSPFVVDYGNRRSGSGGPIWTENNGRDLWIGWSESERKLRQYIAAFPGKRKPRVR